MKQRSTAFDHGQFDEAYPPGMERSYWHRARNAIIGRSLMAVVPSGSHVLEIGCGTGIVTRHLRSIGYEATGTDLGVPQGQGSDAPFLFLGRNALDMPLEFRGTVSALGLFDVIEHVEDAPALLRSLLSAYPNARHVVVTVPARKELWSTFDEHFGHFRRYDRPLLRSEFSAAGLITEAADHFFHGLYPAIALNNLLRGRQRNLRFSAPAPGLASIAHAAVASAFVLENRLLPGALVGSSIIGVARRP